jgi:hypothetical protein
VKKLDEIVFPERGFNPNEVEEAKEFMQHLSEDLGGVSVANTLRTVYMARQKQNLLMKAAREALRRQAGT